MCTKTSNEASYLNNRFSKDFISILWNGGVGEIVEQVLSYLDVNSLAKAGAVCQTWKDAVDSLDIFLWKQLLLRKIRFNSIWRKLYIEKQRCEKQKFQSLENSSYRDLCILISTEVNNLENNWISGKHQRREKRIPELCKRLQLNSEKVFAIPVARRNEILFWDRATLKYEGYVATAERTAIYCFRCNDYVIVASIGDSTVSVWDIKTRCLINTIVHPNGQRCYNLCFTDRLLVTIVRTRCRPLALWDIKSPENIKFRQILGSSEYYSEVACDDKLIVALASKHIDLWAVSSMDLVKTFRRTFKNIDVFLRHLCYTHPFVVTRCWYGDQPRICKWNVETGYLLEGEWHLYTAMYCGTSKIVYEKSEGGGLEVKDVRSGRTLGTLSDCPQTEVNGMDMDEFGIVSLVKTEHGHAIVLRDFLNADSNSSGTYD